MVVSSEQKTHGRCSCPLSMRGIFFSIVHTLNPCHNRRWRNYWLKICWKQFKATGPWVQKKEGCINFSEKTSHPLALILCFPLGPQAPRSAAFLPLTFPGDRLDTWTLFVGQQCSSKQTARHCGYTRYTQYNQTQTVNALDMFIKKVQCYVKVQEFVLKHIHTCAINLLHI